MTILQDIVIETRVSVCQFTQNYADGCKDSDIQWHEKLKFYLTQIANVCRYAYRNSHEATYCATSSFKLIQLQLS